MERRARLMPRRLKKDITELWEAPYSCNGTSVALETPVATADAFQLEIKVAVHEGSYAGGHFRFVLQIPAQYPFKGPVISATMPIWHPNIDLHSRRVLLPVVHEDWSPVLTLNSICFALQLLLLEPNPDYSVNDVASDLYRSAKNEFQSQVQATLAGGCFWGIFFPSHAVRDKRKSADDDLSSTSAYETGDEIKEGIEEMRLQGLDEPEITPAKRVRRSPQDQSFQLALPEFSSQFMLTQEQQSQQQEQRQQQQQRQFPMVLHAPEAELALEPASEESHMLLSTFERFQPVCAQSAYPRFEVPLSQFSWSPS